MNQYELDRYFRSFLNIEEYAGDVSKNGLQVENSGIEITKVAFAVDACEETINRTAEWNAQLLFVHHGLFWGHEQTICGTHYKRISSLIKNDIALYACHIPLDANKICGNNYALATRLELNNLTPFGEWRGMKAGTIGECENPITINQLLLMLFPDGEKPNTILTFGKDKVSRIAIVSGGGSDSLEEAIKENADLFITGEISHQNYHTALENNINLIAAGHYQTETVGVKLVAEKLAKETNIETVFIDVPTGL
ncbi:MAG: Nif3-like dinuclear metal center hexameric protein [Treponema sp.]|jgi:dinuclear metal center YbgI/SA1388 family protein|nr:Nif3-like dinuclear metal center hexameric protein [Treponema sp.]